MQVVICGIEDAHADRDVVRVAAGLSERVGGRLILVHVQPPPLIGLEPQIAYAAARPEPDQIAVARELARVAADAGVAPSTEVRVAYGALEPQLLTAARDEQATAVVVGPGPASRLLGSARCPLVVVPAAAAPRDADTVSVPKGRRARRPAAASVAASRADRRTADGRAARRAADRR
jgi:nucleotide-binding universal stress UspA family protein